MTWLRLSRCPSCGTALRDDWSFCPCGAPVKDLRRVCTHCHRVVDGDAPRCSHCGKALDEIKPTYILIRWHRRPDEFARRMPVGDLKGALDGGVMVDHGTRALFLVDGALRGELQPGWHGTPSDPLSVWSGEEYVHRIEVVAVDAADTPLSWSCAATSGDPYTLQASLSLSLSLASPAALLATLLKDKEALRFDDLRDWLAAEVESGLREAVAAQPAETLRTPTTAFLRDLEAALRARLARPLDSAGLRLERVRSIGVASPRLDELLAERETGAALKDKATEAQSRLAAIEKLQDSLVRRRRLDDDARKQIETSGLLTDAEIQSLRDEVERHRGDEQLGWQHARELLAAKHQAELERLAAETGLRLYVQREEETIRLEGKRASQQVDLEQREREHKVKISLELRDARHRHQMEWAAQVRGMSPEQILAASAASSPEAADALKARFASAGAEEREKLLREMQDRLEHISSNAQDRAFRLAEEAIRAQGIGREREADRMRDAQHDALSGMAHVAGARAGSGSLACPKCGAPNPRQHACCSACGAKLTEVG